MNEAKEMWVVYSEGDDGTWLSAVSHTEARALQYALDLMEQESEWWEGRNDEEQVALWKNAEDILDKLEIWNSAQYDDNHQYFISVESVRVLD